MSRRHSLTKAYQPRSKRSPQPLMEQKSEPTARLVARSAKKLWRRGWPWIIAVVVISLIGLSFGYYTLKGSSSPSVSPEATARNSNVQTVSTPTSAPRNWQTLRTFTGPDTGNATKKSQTFTVSDSWQMTWACQGINGVDDFLYIAIYNSNGSLYNAGAQVTCIAAKRVVGSVQEAKSGTFYLMIDANTSWTITIQVAKQT